MSATSSAPSSSRPCSPSPPPPPSAPSPPWTSQPLRLVSLPPPWSSPSSPWRPTSSSSPQQSHKLVFFSSCSDSPSRLRSQSYSPFPPSSSFSPLHKWDFSRETRPQRLTSCRLKCLSTNGVHKNPLTIYTSLWLKVKVVKVEFDQSLKSESVINPNC